MDKNKKTILKKTDGITLVALVVTIVILIILATVTINAVLGDSGLIKQAEKTKDIAGNFIAKENEDMNRLAQEYANMMAEDSNPPSPEDKTPPTVDVVVGEVTETSISVTVNATDDSGKIASYKYYLNGVEKTTLPTNIYKYEGLTKGTEYTIKVEAFDKANNKGEKTITASTKKGEPTDGSYNEDKGVNSPKLGPNMKLVKFDNNKQDWVDGIEYSYIGKTTIGDNNESKWANAEVTTNGVKSYFVWIPRYAYKIIGKNNIDIKFIKGTGKTAADGTQCKYASEKPTSNDYIIHPAFTNEVDNGGWDSQISGIWVGKYETSGTTSQLKVQAGVSSLRSQTIGNMYTYSYIYARNLESHLLKNSEWGAVAYLTESKYGRNGIEITPNRNSSYYTGGENGKAYIANVSQSSTGNVYGIYDLSGGAMESVAGYYNGSDVNTSNLNNGGTFASKGGKSTKYATAYTGTSASTAYKYGDATYETSGWHADHAYFVNAHDPFFSRGGIYGDSIGPSEAGVFDFSRCNR